MGVGEMDQRAAAQPQIPAGRLVVAIGQPEGVLPDHQIHAIADRVQQHRGIFEARQIEIAGEILNQLLHGDMMTAPERYAVEFHAQARRREAGEIQLVGAQLLAGAHRQGVGAGETQRLPGHRRLRRVLRRHQEPLVGFRQTRGRGAVGGRHLLGNLCFLMRRQTEVRFIGQDRLPGQRLPRRLVQVLQAGLVGRQEYQCVAIQAWRIAPVFQDRLGRPLRRVAGFLAVRMGHTEHHQASVQIVRHIRAGVGQRVNAVKIARARQILLEPPLQFGRYLVRFAFELLGPVFGQLGHRRLG